MIATGLGLAVLAAAASPTPTSSPAGSVSTALAKRVASGNLGPGWLAFSIVVAMGVALALLMRSMRHQVRKIDFVEEPVPGRPNAPDRTIWPTRPPAPPPTAGGRR